MSLPAQTFRTARLDWVAATVALLEAELKGPTALAEMLGADIPAGWPPGEYDRGAIEFLRGRLLEDGEAAEGWYGWYGIRRTPEGRGELVVAAGYFGPPAGGVVEIGYSVVPAAQGEGFATEAVGGLVERALRRAGVERVIAHTTETNRASVRVLEKCGFVRVGSGAEPGTVRFERRSAR